MNSSTDEQQPAKKRRKRARNVDVQDLRRRLLSVCDDYLTHTPLDSLNAAMVRSIGDVVSSVGAEYMKAARQASPSQLPAGWRAPFDVPGVEQPTGVLPPPGTATPANGFPSVPEPSVKGDAGIKSAPSYASGLQRPE